MTMIGGYQMAKATIMKRVDGYMKRAETLKEIVDEQAAAKNGMGTGGGGGWASRLHETRTKLKKQNKKFNDEIVQSSRFGQ